MLGITFKDLDFYGTNHFIKNHGPSIIVSCYLNRICNVVVLFAGNRFNHCNTWEY